jgi:hypothetical protein
MHLTLRHFLHDLFDAVPDIHQSIISFLLLFSTFILFLGAAAGILLAILLFTIFDFDHEFLVFNFFAQQIFNLVTFTVVIKNFVLESVYLSIKLIFLFKHFFVFFV